MQIRRPQIVVGMVIVLVVVVLVSVLVLVVIVSVVNSEQSNADPVHEEP